jgi:hypothetical protein
MPEAHSKHSASNFEANTLCPGRRVMSKGLPDPGSKYADEGTAAHALLEMCLDGNVPAATHRGNHYGVNGKDWPFTEEMIAAVQTALDNIHTIVGDGMLLSEQRVTYASYLGVPDEDGWGTSDVIAARGNELQVHDYKHGMGVAVDAADNPQMKLYALGALAQCQGILGDFDTVRLVIHQPRLSEAPSEWTMSVKDLEAWGYGAARSSVMTQMNAERLVPALPDPGWIDTFLRPNEKSCKFCRAKATCPALRNEAAKTIFDGTAPADPDEFEAYADGDLATPRLEHEAEAWLGAVLSKADLIEDWLKAVRAEVERRLLAGGQVPGFKVVQGKRGNRAWANADVAETALKGMRLKTEEMYDLKLISPTSAEKLAKPAKKEDDPQPLIGPRQWKKLQELITQADGKPHVAPVSDPRPALVLTKAEDDFDTVSTESEFA